MSVLTGPVKYTYGVWTRLDDELTLEIAYHALITPETIHQFMPFGMDLVSVDHWRATVSINQRCWNQVWVLKVKDVGQQPAHNIKSINGLDLKVFVNGRVMDPADATDFELGLTKCECGSDSVSSPRHSTWCGRYQP